MSGFLDAGAPARLGVSGMLDQASREIDKAARLGVRLVTLEDGTYPTLLLEIPDPPPVLYIYGQLEPDDEVRVALVGSRSSTRYGDNAASELASGLGGQGVTIVSGMARGIDAAAHEAALSCRGRTLAVLGSGLARIYPADHAQLAGRIADRGAVISEYPLEAPPLPAFFPRRNRVISGMCCGVVVVEAAERSGALVTARLALEQNRELYAVPGSIFSRTSVGTNGLLVERVAHAAVSPESILDQLPPPFRVRLGLTPSAHEPSPARIKDRAHEPSGSTEGSGRPLPGETDLLTTFAEVESGSKGELNLEAPRISERSSRKSRDRGHPGRGADRERPGRGTDEDLVWRHLSIDEPVSIDDLAEACGLPAQRLLVALSVLEMGGLAEKLPGNRMARTRPDTRRT